MAKDGKEWIARHNLTGAQYQAEFKKHTRAGFKLRQVESCRAGSSIRYAAISARTAGRRSRPTTVFRLRITRSVSIVSPRRAGGRRYLGDVDQRQALLCRPVRQRPVRKPPSEVVPNGLPIPATVQREQECRAAASWRSSRASVRHDCSAGAAVDGMHALHGVTSLPEIPICSAALFPAPHARRCSRDSLRAIVPPPNTPTQSFQSSTEIISRTGTSQ